MSFIPPFTIKGVPISNYSINILSKELNTTVYALPDGQSAQELTTVIIIGLDQCSFIISVYLHGMTMDRET